MLSLCIEDRLASSSGQMREQEKEAGILFKMKQQNPKVPSFGRYYFTSVVCKYEFHLKGALTVEG